ncbi:MAG TPA: hypothetical protein VL199_01765 [Burkholderiales bacterium]|jgi:hypothetical protein|nr:hypothetical protein [Burkholderiales bacterium]
MAYRCAVVLLLAMALASCSPGRRSSTTSTESDAETAKRPALTQTQPPEAAGRAYMLTPGAGVGAAVPPMEPGRPINNQDCTKEVALTGNLNCR